MNNDKIMLSLSLANNILQYLAKRPYQDVFMLIQQLQAEISPQLQQKNTESSTSNSQ
jgi:hypothetical protein